MVTICNKDIPNELNELTIQQFEDITSIHANPDMDHVEKHLEVFKYMGVPEVEDMDFEDFKEAIRVFNTAKNPDGVLLKQNLIRRYFLRQKRKSLPHDLILMVYCVAI